MGLLRVYSAEGVAALNARRGKLPAISKQAMKRRSEGPGILGPSLCLIGSPSARRSG